MHSWAATPMTFCGTLERHSYRLCDNCQLLPNNTGIFMTAIDTILRDQHCAEKYGVIKGHRLTP